METSNNREEKFPRGQYQAEFLKLDPQDNVIETMDYEDLRKLWEINYFPGNDIFEFARSLGYTQTKWTGRLSQKLPVSDIQVTLNPDRFRYADIPCLVYRNPKSP